MKISLLASASCVAVIACGGATRDQAATASTGGSSGALVTGGAAGSSGGAGARSSGGQAGDGTGGGAPRCNGPTLTPLNLYPSCDGNAQTICVEVPFQVCYCDGTTAFGFGIPVPIRHLGPCTDAERPDADVVVTDAGGD